MFKKDTLWSIRVINLLFTLLKIVVRLNAVNAFIGTQIHVNIVTLFDDVFPRFLLYNVYVEFFNVHIYEDILVFMTFFRK